MTIDKDNLLNSILESIDRIKFVNSDDIPNIDLYVDQVTTFMDKALKSTTRYKDQDKVLTKTMINNYAKNDLLPSPIKKKYSKEHVLVLVFIYYFKNILSINDIQNMLNPLTDKYFGKDEYSIKEVYDEVTKIDEAQIEELKKDIKAKYAKASEGFDGVPEEDQEFLQLFSFITMLATDVYIKKLLIEKMIDEYTSKHIDDIKPDKKNKS